MEYRPCDFHTHSFWSDGVLSPAELCYRAVAKGYRVLAITDHVDASNIFQVIENIVRFCEDNAKEFEKLGLTVIPGVELTYVSPSQIDRWTKKARKAGAKIVVVHGETPVEPVPKGTNKAAIEAGVDILAHPGFISEEEVELAKKYHVFLEITSRRGHCLTNGYVAKLAKKIGAYLILNTDAHGPEDLLTGEQFVKVAIGAGLEKEDIENIAKNAEFLAKKALGNSINGGVI